MSYLPPDKKKPADGPTPTRIAIWVLVGGVGLYLVGSGIIGIINAG